MSVHFSFFNSSFFHLIQMTNTTFFIISFRFCFQRWNSYAFLTTDTGSGLPFERRSGGLTVIYRSNGDRLVTGTGSISAIYRW
jgi:hypothetical protein